MNEFRLGVVGVVPFWSQADSMNTDSNFVYLRELLPEFERQTTETVFVVFIPDPQYGRGRWRFKNDWIDSDRVAFVRWPYDTSMRGSVLSFDPVRFAEIDEQFAPVVYWLQQVESAASMAGGYLQSFNKSSRPTMIAQHFYIIHDSLPYRTDGLFPRLWAQLGGSLASDVVVYNTDHARRMARESFTEFLAIKKYAELERKSTTHKWGLVKSDQRIAPVATADDRPSFLYNHRLEAYKKPEITFGLFADLRGQFDFDVVLAQPPTQKSGGKKRIHFDRRLWEPNHDDYLDAIAFPAINMINSVHETYCISMVDSIAAGHLVVAPNAVTFPELVPRDYPFLFNNEREQRSMVKHILGTWPDEFNKWRPVMAQHARDTFGIEQYVAGYLRIMADAEAVNRDHKPKSSTLETMNRVWDSIGKPITPNEFRRRMQRVGRKQAGSQAFTARRIIRDSLHFRDDVGVELQNNRVVLVKRPG